MNTQEKKPKLVPSLTESELSELPTLPQGWEWIRLGQVSRGVEYGTSSKSEPQGKIPVIRMGNIQNCSLDWSDLVYTNDAEDIRKYTLKNNDVLFNRTNSPALVGKTAIYRGERPAIFAGYLIRINQIDDLVDARYLNYYLNSPIAKNIGNKVKSDGVNQSNISGTKLVNYPFPYCSVNQQVRIINKIEELFSELDNAVASLKAAQQQLRLYRQVILNWAFEGRLTTDMRSKKSKNSLINAADLPANIEQPRDTIRKPNEKNSGMQLESRRGIDETCADLPPLPKGWTWTRLGRIATEIKIGPFGSLLHKSDYVVGGVPLVNPSHIRDQKIVPDLNLTVANPKLEQLTNYRLRERDIVMGRRGEMGRCAVVTQKEAGYICGTGSVLIRIPEVLNSDFYCAFLGSPRVRNFLEGSSVGTTMSNLNEKILHAIRVPMCSREEQNAVMDELASRLSQCDVVAKCIEDTLLRTESLRHSILKRAFCGVLVPPTGEPDYRLRNAVCDEREPLKV